MFKQLQKHLSKKNKNKWMHQTVICAKFQQQVISHKCSWKWLHVFSFMNDNENSKWDTGELRFWPNSVLLFYWTNEWIKLICAKKKCARMHLKVIILKIKNYESFYFLTEFVVILKKFW